MTIRKVTITIDDKLDKRVRNYLAYKIKLTGKTYSYSKVIRDILDEGLPL